MKSCHFPIFCLVMLSLPCFAGEKLTGRVLDSEDKAPIGMASVRIVDNTGKIKRFTSTNNEGIFSISFPDGCDSCRLQVSKMGYASQLFGRDTLPSYEGDTLSIMLDIEAIALNEVGVRAKRIREQGDTVSYNVGMFTREQDRSIGEVMNRMPGLEVDNKGKVQYQGTDINKFYVEGTDVAGDSYGMLTKGVEAKDVSAVEVLENHQPMQVLRGLSYSDQAAVNLKLKEKSKTKLMAHGSAGGGYGTNAGGLYSGDLFLMTVKGKVQNVTNISLNNTGDTGGSGRLIIGSDTESLNRYLSGSTISSTGKSVFNRSANINTSTVWKNNKGGRWRILAEYSYNHLWADRSSVRTYYLEGGNEAFVETSHADSHAHNGRIEANYELNEKTYYLNNIFNAEINGNDARTDIGGTLTNRQDGSDSYLNLTNKLKIIRRFGQKHLVTFNSINQWLNRPEELKIYPGTTSARQETQSYGSRVHQYAFYTDERASYGFIIGKVVTSIEGGVSGYIRHIDSNLSGIEPTAIATGSNDFSTNYFRVFASPKFELNRKRIKLNLSFPLNFYTYFFGGAISNRNEFFIAPALGVQWTPDSRHTLNLNASARRSPASLSNILRNPIMTDYRTFNSGTDDYYSSTGQNIGLRWEWRNTRSGWFAYAQASQSWSKLKAGVSQMLIGDYVVNAYRAEPSSSESTRALGRINKSLDVLNSTIGCLASWSRSESTVFSQGEAMNRRIYEYSIAPNLDMQFTSWLNGNYNFLYNYQDLRLGAIPTNTIHSLTHRFSLTATPGKWQFSINGSHVTESYDTDSSSRRFDLNASIVYRLNKQIDLRLDGSNLTDGGEYISRSFDELSTFESISRLRGREIVFSIRISK